MTKQTPLWDIEEGLLKQGYEFIAGVDEAGRGPLAGPVYAAAVVLPYGIHIPGLNDSKKLSDKKRRELYEIIKKEAISYFVCDINERIIDEINILNATFLAMNTALSNLPEADFAIIDGNQIKNCPLPFECVVKGDQKSMSIAAASILAKVERDIFMEEMAVKYPGYGFEQHKGYGTKAHIERILSLGPCELHRKSFLTKILK